jgi:KUP system potassium uptake protein
MTTDRAETSSATTSDSNPHHGDPEKSSAASFRLAIGALGVVYGDIGTSPLYAVRECFGSTIGIAATPENLLGVLSLIFWSLVMVVVVKYLTFVLRADNRGEEGILALLALLLDAKQGDGADAALGRRRNIFVLLGLFGAALLLADGMITPAISVLSAIEGLNVAAPALEHWIVPITLGILIGLFMVQSHGTERISGIFGPTMLIWFLTLALMGLPWIVRRPEVLAALNPIVALRMCVQNPLPAFLLLGAVVLCITGAEALYADMGHFGRRPIRRAWYVVVFPALLVNDFGQVAFLLSRGGDIMEKGTNGVLEPINVFYEMGPPFFVYPVLGIATLAAVIASQALITGAFSLAQQAVQLHFSPRLTVVHTSGEMVGQIYVPFVNRILMIACVLLVIGFEHSSNLAAAYGIAVVSTMLITSLLLFEVARMRWGWGWLPAAAMLVLFLATDVPFLLANATKIVTGGWVPLAIGGVIFLIMTTWKRGRALLSNPLYSETFAYPLALFLRDVERNTPVRVGGTGVFMTSDPENAPGTLLSQFELNRVLPERIVLLSVVTRPVPKVRGEETVAIQEHGHGFYGVTAAHGFMEHPNVPYYLDCCRHQGLELDPKTTTFYLSRITVVTSGNSPLPMWRKTLFAFLYQNERAATAFFRLPPNRVVELGRQVEL